MKFGAISLKKYFVNNCVIKVRILVLLHICNTHYYDYLTHTTFRFDLKSIFS